MRRVNAEDRDPRALATRADHDRAGLPSAEEQPAWRQDFPIDWPQDQYVERRDFVKFLVLTSGPSRSASSGLPVQNWWRRRRGPAAIAPHRRRSTTSPSAARCVFEYPAEHDPCVLVGSTRAEFVAYSQKCTHLSCAVIPRPEQGVAPLPVSRGLLRPAHRAADRRAAARPLPRILLEIRGGEVYATGVERRTT